MPRNQPEVGQVRLRRGADQRTGAAVVVVAAAAADQYRKLAPREGSLVAFFRWSALVGIELEITRSADVGRPVAL